MYHYIYKIEFLLGEPGRYYIGKRSTSIKPENDSYKGSGRFCRAYFNKYGIDNSYKKTILEVNTSKEINAEREKYWIGNLWKTDPLCMNMIEGGILGGAPKGVDRSGSKNSFYGKHHTEETKRLISEKNKGTRCVSWGWKNKKIGCYNDNCLIKIYTSRDEVKNDGYNPKCIDNCLSGRSKPHKGLIFKIIN